MVRCRIRISCTKSPNLPSLDAARPSGPLLIGVQPAPRVGPAIPSALVPASTAAAATAVGPFGPVNQHRHPATTQRAQGFPLFTSATSKPNTRAIYCFPGKANGDGVVGLIQRSACNTTLFLYA
jgi:hypothetical protein